MRALLKSEWTIFVIALLAGILTGVLTFAGANSVLIFLISAIALATLASVVGQATEQLGNYLGPGPTGILQASVASMPELFVSFVTGSSMFPLRSSKTYSISLHALPALEEYLLQA